MEIPSSRSPLAFLAALASVQSAQAEFYWWKGQTAGADCGLATNWTYGIDGPTGLPGDDADVVVSGSFGYSPVTLDQDRTHHTFTIGVGEIDLGGQALTTSDVTQLQGNGVIRNGTLSALVTNVWSTPGYDATLDHVTVLGNLYTNGESGLNLSNSTVNVGGIGTFGTSTMNVGHDGQRYRRGPRVGHVRHHLSPGCLGAVPDQHGHPRHGREDDLLWDLGGLRRPDRR